MCMCSLSFSLSNSTYVGQFVVVLGGMKYRLAAPRHDMALQIIWLDGCFIVATTYFLTPNVRAVRYKLLHGAFVRKQHFLPLSESPMAMTSCKVQSLFLHHWCEVWLSCRPVGIHSKFFAETSRNSAGTCCCIF